MDNNQILITPKTLYCYKAHCNLNKFHFSPFSGFVETSVKLNKNMYSNRCQDLEPDFLRLFLSERREPKRKLCTKFHCNPLWGLGETVINECVREAVSGTVCGMYYKYYSFQFIILCIVNYPFPLFFLLTVQHIQTSNTF